MPCTIAQEVRAFLGAPTNPPPLSPFRPDDAIGALRPADIPTVGVNDPNDSRAHPPEGTDDQG
jgi:hypothetical protein